VTPYTDFRDAAEWFILRCLFWGALVTRLVNPWY
jgi:hypothetical protein